MKFRRALLPGIGILMFGSCQKAPVHIESETSVNPSTSVPLETAPTPIPEPTTPPQTPALNPPVLREDPSALPLAYRDYGPLYLEEGKIAGESANRGWSAWWYPRRGTELFAPLEKYDLFTKLSYHESSNAAEIERTQFHNPNAQFWEGLCHAWAMASLLNPEPKLPVSLGELVFTPSDQKALLIKTYENFAAPYYGQRFSDTLTSDWSNIAPHLFHRIILGEIVEKGRPVIMNKVPGMEVWNVPVWKVVTELERSTKTAPNPGWETWSVKTWLLATSAYSAPEETDGLRTEVHSYTYLLYSRRDSAGKNLAMAGEWTGLSRDQHPSIIMPLPALSSGHYSGNPAIRADRVAEILALPPTS